MDPDLNKYDLEHVCTGHPIMSTQQWQNIYHQAWNAFYTPEHFETILRRTASRARRRAILKAIVWFYGFHRIEQVHPLQGGLLRRKYRLDRRPSLPVESPVIFHLRFAWQLLRKLAGYLALARKFKAIHSRVENYPMLDQYMDLAMTPAAEENEAEIEMYHASDAAIAAVEKVRQRQTRRIVSTAAE